MSTPNPYEVSKLAQRATIATDENNTDCHQVRFVVSIDDIVELNLHITEKNPAIRGSVRRTVITLTILALVMVLIPSTQFLSFRLGFGGFFLAVVVLMLVKLRPGRRKMFRRIFEKDADRVCTERLMMLHDEGLLCATPRDKTITYYHCILRIEETPQHFFVYLAEIAAYPIPRQGLLEGDADAFIRGLRGRMVQAASSQSGLT